LTVADVRIALSGAVNVAALSPHFGSFLVDSSASDLGLEAHSRGADNALLRESPAPESAWEFRIREGICGVSRRHRNGATLWRIAAPLSYDRFEVTWHPLLFPEIYGSYERAWSAGLGRLLLLLRLHRHGGLIVHGMSAELAGQGILCLGVSGVGKSTMARLLHGAGARVLSDERPVLRRWPTPEPGRTAPGPPAIFRVYGSPWPSSGGFVHNGWAPLRRVYLLEHGGEDRLTPLAPRDAVTRLIQVAPMIWQEPRLMDPCLATLETLLGAVPCATLAFRPTPAAVKLIEDDLSR
jgi:hypothetical protein